MTPQTPSAYKPTIRYKGGTRYDVQSRTRPDHMHHVDTYHLTCTCEAGRYGKRCWAIGAAQQYEAWRRHEQAKAAAVHPHSSEFHRSAGYRGLAECF